MPGTQYYRSFSIHNYRKFRELSIDNLTRVNIIGGKNSTGKTALLEALFMFLDRRNPALTSRTIYFRTGTSATPDEFLVFENAFHQGDTRWPVEFAAKTRLGNERLVLRRNDNLPPQLLDVVMTAPLRTKGEPGASPQFSTSLTGFSLEHFYNSQKGVTLHLRPMPDGVRAFVDGRDIAAPPHCAMISAVTRHNAGDNANRFTAAVQQNLGERLLELVRYVQPDLNQLQLLTPGGQPTIYGHVGISRWLPSSLLGEGAHTLLSIGLAMIDARDGAVMLDEFDTAIHYSMQRTVWRALSELAVDMNCQLFATTHSRECIQAASDALTADALQYTRLDRIGTDIAATSYSGTELSAALKAEWEIR